MINDEATKIVTAKDISKRIGEKLVESGWYDKLHIYLGSSDFTGIIQQLIDKVEVEKQRFVPSMGNMCNFLEKTPYNTLKAVMLLEYVNNKLQFADGLPLHPDMKASNALLTAVYNSMDHYTPNPEHMQRQGVLIIPLALTARMDGKPHKGLWQSFILRLIEAINKEYKDIPWILMGKECHQYAIDIKSPNIRKIVISRPMVDNQWDSWTNEVIRSQGKEEVSW